MKSPFFSIIVPVYNGAALIARCIQRVLKQSFRNFELIIVDDGSADETDKAVKSFLSDPRISYMYQSNRGVSAARNRGVMQASGKFLIFLDCDDEPATAMLAQYYHAIVHNEKCLLLFAQFANQGKVKGLRENSFLFNVPVSVIPGSYCIERILFVESGGFDEDMSHSENWELMIRIGLHPDMNAERIEIIHEPLLIYTAVYSKQKLLANKRNKLKSYSSLFFKHRNKSQYSRKLISYFAQVVANNYAGLGDFLNVIRWTIKSIHTYPFDLQNYYKPVLIFFKRRVLPYQ